jgi:hypothetical protein
MKLKASLLCSRELVISPYTEAYKSNTHPHLLLSLPNGLFLSVFLTQLGKYSYSLKCVGGVYSVVNTLKKITLN